MTTVKRDPRVNPQAGDVIVKGSGSRFTERIVIARNGNFVDYKVVMEGTLRHCDLKLWSKWALDTKVKKVAAC